MVKTKSVYDKEVIKEISKPLAKKALITSLLFTVALLGLGIFFLITSILEFEERGVFNIVVACITIVFSGYPLFKAIKQNKESLKTAIADMGVDKSSIEINLTVREKRIEVTTVQGDEVKNSTVLIRNISEVKINKNAIGIYVKDNMYYVQDGDYIEGSRAELINVFKKAGIQIKGK